MKHTNVFCNLSQRLDWKRLDNVKVLAQPWNDEHELLDPFFCRVKYSKLNQKYHKIFATSHPLTPTLPYKKKNP